MECPFTFRDIFKTLVFDERIRLLSVKSLF